MLVMFFFLFYCYLLLRSSIIKERDSMLQMSVWLWWRLECWHIIIISRVLIKQKKVTYVCVLKSACLNTSINTLSITIFNIIFWLNNFIVSCPHNIIIFIFLFYVIVRMLLRFEFYFMQFCPGVIIFVEMRSGCRYRVIKWLLFGGIKNIILWALYVQTFLNILYTLIWHVAPSPCTPNVSLPRLL